MVLVPLVATAVGIAANSLLAYYVANAVDAETVARSPRSADWAEPVEAKTGM